MSPALWKYRGSCKPKIPASVVQLLLQIISEMIIYMSVRRRSSPGSWFLIIDWAIGQSYPQTALQSEARLPDVRHPPFWMPVSAHGSPQGKGLSGTVSGGDGDRVERARRKKASHGSIALFEIFNS